MQIAKTLALGASVLGALVMKPDDREKDFMLPLLALGLRREHEGSRRVYCIPVHAKFWVNIAGICSRIPLLPGKPVADPHVMLLDMRLY